VTTVLTAKFDFSQPKSAIKGTQAQVDQLKNKAKGAQGALDNAAKSAKGAGVASAFFGKAAKGAVPGVAALGGALKVALGPIALLTSAAGILTSAFSTLAEQDFAEAKVRTLGVNSEELKGRLSDVSRELSGQASVVELTAAAYDVASAGFNDAASAAQVLKASSLAATGGFSDLNTVADATTSVLNSYGLGAEAASRITDQFIQTQNDGKIVIDQYAANIAKVAPVAAALGIGLDEVNAAVAQITGTGTGAEVTFTALKTAFAQLASGGVGEKLKQFGVNIDANTIAADGFVGTLKKIKDSGADTGAILKAFGTEAGPVLQPLLNDFDKLNKLLENQRNAQGAAAKAAFEAGNTINGSLKRLQTAFTNIFADGSELGVLLKGTFQVAAVTVEVFGAALQLVLAPIRGVIQGITTFFKKLSPLKDNVNLAFELEKGFQAVMTGVDFATKAITGFFAVVGEGFYTQLGNVLTFANSIREGIVGIFNDLGATITNTLKNLYANIPRPIQFIIEQAGKGFKAVQGFLGEAVSGVINRIKGAGQGIAQGVKDLAVVGGLNQAASTQGSSGAANAIQQTGGGLLTSGGGTQPAEKETPLQKQQKAAAKLIEAQTRKNQLDAASTDEARKLLELKFKEQDIDKQFALLAPEKIENLKELFRENDRITKEKSDQKKLDDAAKKKADELADAYKKLGDAIKTNVTDAIIGAIEGTKSLGEAALDVVKQLAKQFLTMGINQAFGALGNTGGILGMLFGGGRASGGTVKGGTSYMVGERGPELFTPGRSGSIAPNSAMGGANVIVNVDASGSSVEGDADQAAQLGKMLGAAVQAELVKQKRPGGLLAS